MEDILKNVKLGDVFIVTPGNKRAVFLRSFYGKLQFITEDCEMFVVNKDGTHFKLTCESTEYDIFEKVKED